MNSHFTRSTWVYSIAAVLLALFGHSRYRLAHDRSVVEKTHTTQKTFTPYDMYDFEKSVTLRSPG